MNHNFLSLAYVQPIVDKFIVLTYRYLEERANQYNGLNVPLRGITVPLTLDTSGHAFPGKTVLSAIFSNRPSRQITTSTFWRMFMKDPVNTLDELVTIIE